MTKGSLAAGLFALALATVIVHTDPCKAQSVRYVSPVPGSKEVSSQTTIILGVSAQIDQKNIPPDNPITVTGSLSGRHGGEVVMADDFRTLIFTPSAPFFPGERIQVSLGSGILTSTGIAVKPFEFNFTITTEPGLIPDPRTGWDLTLSTGSARTPLASSTRPDFSLVHAAADALPKDFPHIVTTYSSRPTPGRIYLGALAVAPVTHTAHYLMVVDTAGRPAFFRRQGGFSVDFKEQPNGLRTYFDQNASAYFAMDSTYTVVDSFRCGNGYPVDGHDFLLLPNGHALLLGVDVHRVNMDSVITGGRPGATVVGDVIQELDSRKNVVFQWRTWDHFRITDATHEDLTAAVIDYAHVNSLDVDTDGNLLLSFRHLDEVTKIDRSTGEIIWRLGGKNNDFVFVNDTLGFSHQHGVRRLGNGHITIFDNGNFHSPPFSRVVEYAVDEGKKSATLAWQYRNVPDIFGSAMGYAQRLPNGNTFIGWGLTTPTLTEIRPDGSKVLEMSYSQGVYSYRAFLAADKGNAASVPPTPAGAWEFRLEQNYPNPFNPTTGISYRVPEASDVKLGIYDVLGREVAVLVNERKAPGSYQVRFDAPGLASGVYLYRIQAGAIVQTRRMLLIK